MKIKRMKYFVHVCMCYSYAYIYVCMCMLATKIRLHENFTNEIFYWQKYPDLWYCRSYDKFFTWADKLSDQNELGLDIDTKYQDTELLMHVHLHCT